MSTEAQSVADIVRASQRHETNVNPSAEEVLIFPDKTLVALEKYAPRPKRKRASVTVLDGASFVEYVKNHSQPGTAIFGVADLNGGRFEGVLDYHEGNADLGIEGSIVGIAEARAQWGEHRVKFPLAMTPEWQRWVACNEKPIQQLAFAELLEDCLADIQKPSGIEMLEFAQTLQMAVAVDFKSAIKISNGQTQLQYVETIEQKAGQGGEMTVPTEFELALQPFVGAPKYLVRARLRTKVINRAVVFQYLLDRPHKVIETAFADVRKDIADKTGLPVLLGSVASIGL